LTPNESVLTFRGPNFCTKFRQNRTKNATVGARTQKHKDANGFYPRYASAGLCDSDVSVCPSVRTSVCHTPELCLAERKQDREMYTI